MSHERPLNIPHPHRTQDPELPSTPEKRTAAEQYFQESLLGNSTTSGILERIRTSPTEQERTTLEREISNLAYDAEALMLFGHADAISVGLQALQTAKAAYHETKKQTQAMAQRPSSNPLDQSERAGQALMIANRWTAIHRDAQEILMPVLPMEPDTFRALRTRHAGSDGLWNQVLMPHRMLKARLLAFGMKHELLDSLSDEERTLLIPLEPNDLGDPLMTYLYGGWEEGYTPINDCDAATFKALGERFNALCKRAEILQGLKNGGNDKNLAWMRQFLIHQNTWFQLKMDMADKVAVAD